MPAAAQCRRLEDPQQPEPLQDRPAGKNHDEREQVQSQRNGPQQRHRAISTESCAVTAINNAEGTSASASHHRRREA